MVHTPLQVSLPSIIVEDGGGPWFGTFSSYGGPRGPGYGGNLPIGCLSKMYWSTKQKTKKPYKITNYLYLVFVLFICLFCLFGCFVCLFVFTRGRSKIRPIFYIGDMTDFHRSIFNRKVDLSFI